MTESKITITTGTPDHGTSRRHVLQAMATAAMLPTFPITFARALPVIAENPTLNKLWKPIDTTDGNRLWHEQ